MKKFLWYGSDESRAKAKVALDDVCKPRRKGDSEFWSLRPTIRQLNLKHICALCADDEDALWPSWVISRLLKGHNFWSIKIPNEA